MLCIHPHDACVMHHLGENHDRIWSLHDLMQIIVEIVRQRRWAGRRTESEQPALAERPLLRVIESAGRRSCAILAIVSGGRRGRPRRRETLARGLVVGRQMTLRRVDDDGCLNLPSDHGVGRALVKPETIIAADDTAPTLLQSFKERFRFAGVAAHRRRRAIRRQGLVASGAFGPALCLGSLQSFGSFLCQERRIPRPPLQRRHRGEVVGALEVGMSIRRSRQVRLYRGARHLSRHRESCQTKQPERNSQNVRRKNESVRHIPHLLDYSLSGCFRYLPYSSSSTNSTHLKSSSCAFFSWRRWSGMLIFQERVKTFGSSMVAS